MRRDDRNWRLGILYVCAADPRVVVRNRRSFGWTWNFGHRLVWLVIPAYVLAFFSPLLLTRAPLNAGPEGVIPACLLVFGLMGLVSRHIASGPHPG